MANQLFKGLTLTIIVLVVALSGCANSSVAPPPAESGQVATTDPTPDSTRSSAAGSISNSTPVASAFVGAAPAQAIRSLSWNTTGDALIRFELTAPKFAICDVVAEVNFRQQARLGSFFMLEGSSGAGFTYGSGESLHAGPVDTAQTAENDTQAVRNEIRGESWGTTSYTIAVRNMVWWPNSFVKNATMRINVTCEAAFEISNVTGSRAVTILTEANFKGGVGAGPIQQSAAMNDKWQGLAVGSKVSMVGLVFGYGPAIHMTATTSKDSFVWQSANNDANHLLFREIPAGNLALSLDALSGHLGLVVGDFEPLPIPENLLPGGQA